MKPQLVRCFASASPSCFCQLGTTFASDTGRTIAVSVARLTLAENTCDCSSNNIDGDYIIRAQATEQIKAENEFIDSFALCFSDISKIRYNY
jgi:hypothetical protein